MYRACATKQSNTASSILGGPCAILVSRRHVALSKVARPEVKVCAVERCKLAEEQSFYVLPALQRVAVSKDATLVCMSVQIQVVRQCTAFTVVAEELRNGTDGWLTRRVWAHVVPAFSSTWINTGWHAMTDATHETAGGQRSFA